MEYVKLGLPKPDLTVFLDMPVEYAKQLMKDRENKIDHSRVKDIHESNDDYLFHAYNNACAVAEKYGWTHIRCVRDGKVRSADDISAEIMDSVKKIL